MESVDRNIFEMTAEEKEAAGIESLPQSLDEAINEFLKDKFVQDILGEHISEKLVEAKKREWQEYREKVTNWELEEYLHKY